jgi:para-aminobenzoate synthetase
VLIVEGVGAGAVPCPDLVDLSVWLEVDVELRRRRALARDGDLFAPHWDDWAAQEEQLFAQRGGMSRADVVLRETDGAAVTTLAARVDGEMGPPRA